MNYINRIAMERDAAHNEIMRLRLMIDDLRSYLVSPKFAGGETPHELDNYVNVRDVLARISEV